MKNAGFTHIIRRHAGDFYRAFGIEQDDIPSFLESVIANGKLVSSIVESRNGLNCYTKVYDYNHDYFVVSGIGQNGFIVSAFPFNKEVEQ